MQRAHHWLGVGNIMVRRYGATSLQRNAKLPCVPCLLVILLRLNLSNK